MVDSPEELEPLFNYSRVQPFSVVSIDDEDSDFSTPPPPKKIKGDYTIDDVKEIIVNNVGENVENWLPSPPKESVVDIENEVSQDSIIKQLRLKKQVLESITVSADDVLRAVEESATAEECHVIKPLEKAVERPKIVISIQNKDGLQLFRVFKDDKLEKIFKSYAEKQKCNFKDLVFCFDGDRIDPTATPESLEMEDDDIIEVHFKKH